jgi:glyoxylase-like metal-dependent hydrolase (beta-lactamase superfamily II)
MSTGAAIPEHFEPGMPRELAPGVVRLVAPNPGRMTGPGTNTYLLGRRRVAVIDPGPADPSHLDAIRRAAAGEIRWILATHTHLDHSPAVAPLAAATGAEVLGRPAPTAPRHDPSFVPQRILDDGDRLTSEEFTLRAVATPGHASNHLCYLEESLGWLFTGDHLINGSTVVIDPPDGNMHDYLASLERLKSLPLNALAPGHGDLVRTPQQLIQWTIDHRLAREAKVIAAVRSARTAPIAALLPLAYDDVAAELVPIAERSLLAHLVKLRDEGRASLTADGWMLLE